MSHLASYPLAKPQSKEKGLSFRLPLLAIIGALTLTACGIKGDLKTPPPLWGADKPASDTEVQPSEVDEDSVLNDNAIESNDESNLYEERVDDPFNPSPN